MGSDRHNRLAGGVDLHAHTTASDGDHSPTELVERAARLGLAAIAVTDHDTTAGVAEAEAAGSRLGVEILPGIELSAEVERGQCHILGLGIDPKNSLLLERLCEVVDRRNSRNARIVRKMRDELGFDVSLDEVEAEAGGAVVARPHFARVLLRKGIVGSMQEAFDIYLGKGGKAYLDRERLSQREAIELIHGAGGLAVLAHPKNLKLDPESTAVQIEQMGEMGLDGFEARYNLHRPEDTERFLALADRLGMATAGGSDFHGASVKPKVFLGHVVHTSADLMGVEGAADPTPLSVYAAIKERLARSSSQKA